MAVHAGDRRGGTIKTGWASESDLALDATVALHDGVGLLGAVLEVLITLAVMEPSHDRIPAIVEPPDWPLWLGETEGDAASLLHPAEDTLRVWPVRKRANRPANNTTDLLAPLPRA
jgi:hypothetical protein